MATNVWELIGTIKNWKGQAKDVYIFHDDDTIAVGMTESGTGALPLINQTFIMTKDEFTTFMGLAVQTLNPSKI